MMMSYVQQIKIPLEQIDDRYRTYLFHTKRPSKYETPSILDHFLTSKKETAALPIIFYVAS